MLHNQIRLYPFDSEDNDEEELQLNERIREMLPFAVVGSERTVVIDGKAVRGRKNRWGVINCEDERHCEFVYLRNFLTRWVGRAPVSILRFRTPSPTSRFSSDLTPAIYCLNVPMPITESISSPFLRGHPFGSPLAPIAVCRGKPRRLGHSYNS